MGRYYTSNNSGEQGKFWFGVQSSSDVEDVYGMTMVEPPMDEDWDGYGEWWADYDTDDTQYVIDQLNKQYDILGVPQEERIYEYEEDKLGDYIWNTLAKYFMTDVQIGKAIGYAMGEGKPTMYPISKEKELAASRVDLGLFILNDIKHYGVSSINAEF